MFHQYIISHCQARAGGTAFVAVGGGFGGPFSGEGVDGGVGVVVEG